MEFDLALCVGAARDDFDMVVKAMFRPRGETQRIDIADAIGRSPFRELKLETPFSEAIGGMRYCLKIRNQYAHCHFTYKARGRLGFVKLEEPAGEHTNIKEANLKVRYLNYDLLEKQESYFVYVQDCLQYLRSKAKPDEDASYPLAKPKKVRQPPPFLPLTERYNPSSATDQGKTPQSPLRE